MEIILDFLKRKEEEKKREETNFVSNYSSLLFHRLYLFQIHYL